MKLPETLLDTDILSAIMRQKPLALEYARKYLQEYQGFTFSIITRYEILRGLKAKNAATQLQRFDRFCQTSIILPLSERCIDKASDIYAHLKQRGRLIHDADILIAATAIVHDMTLATNNEQHFYRIEELSIKNWLK